MTFCLWSGSVRPTIGGRLVGLDHRNVSKLRTPSWGGTRQEAVTGAATPYVPRRLTRVFAQHDEQHPASLGRVQGVRNARGHAHNRAWRGKGSLVPDREGQLSFEHQDKRVKR